MINLGNAMARNMKIRPGRNSYGLVLVQSAYNMCKKCHSFTVTMFHNHPANVVDEQFGKYYGEKYETPAREKSLKTGFSTICTPPAGKWLLRPE